MSDFTPRRCKSISRARAAGENRLNNMDLMFIIELVSQDAICTFCRVTDEVNAFYTPLP